MDNDQRQGDKNMITIINLQKVLTLNILMSVLMNYLLNLISEKHFACCVKTTRHIIL